MFSRLSRLLSWRRDIQQNSFNAIAWVQFIRIVIHQTHYEKSDWSRAFNQFTITCELDMINAISAASPAVLNVKVTLFPKHQLEIKLITSCVTLSLWQVVLKGSCLSNPVLECRFVKVQITLYGFRPQSTFTFSPVFSSFHFGWHCTPLTPALLLNTSFSSVPFLPFGRKDRSCKAGKFLGATLVCFLTFLSPRQVVLSVSGNFEKL